MTRIYTLANQKGGVGKTTTAINLGAYLAYYGQRVLLVDLDPQANATSCLKIDKHTVRGGTYDMLIGNASASKYILHNPRLKLSILPASPALAGGEVELVNELARESRLKNGLVGFIERYDYILIDCPPSLGLLTLNGLVAARDGVIIPVQCEYLALEGLSQLTQTLERVKSVFPDLHIRGLVMTMFDGRTNLSNDVVQEVQRHFPDMVFKTLIPRSVRLAEAPSYGLPITKVRAQFQWRARLHFPGTGNFSWGWLANPHPGRDIMPRKYGLGRGLDALIPGSGPPAAGGVENVRVDQVLPNPRQPRTHFDPGELDELADSIRSHGLIQPLILTRSQGEEGYILVAGERRLKAARIAGLSHVPALVREASELERLELALIENLHRADLGPLETAEAYRQLVEEFGLSHEDIANQVGKSRVAVTNTLRLLKLSPAVKDALAERKISEGHARNLLTLPTPQAQSAVLKTIIDRDLNVRQTEELVRRLSGGKPQPKVKPEPSPEIRDLETRLETSLGTRVNLNMHKKGGTIVIHYYSDEDLDTLVERLAGDIS